MWRFLLDTFVNCEFCFVNLPLVNYVMLFLLRFFYGILFYFTFVVGACIFLFSFFHVCSWTWLRRGYIWFFVLQDKDSQVFTFPLLCTVSCIFINNMFRERIWNWNVIAYLSFLVISNLGVFLSLLTLFCIGIGFDSLMMILW